MKNRIIAFFLAAALMVSLLAGCGKGNNANNIQDTETESIESGSEVINNSNTEKDDEVVGKDGTSEIEIGTEDMGKDTSADMELDNPEKEDKSSDQNEGITGNRDKSSKNLSVGSGSEHNTNSNNDTPSIAGNSENTGNNPSVNTNISDNVSADNNPETEKDKTTSIVMAESSKEAFDLINAERVKLGLKPAVWDEECERIALIRAEEIAAMGTSELFENAHAGFDKFWYENFLLCECVAWGFTNAGGAVNGWMNSDGHRNVLMDEGRVKLAVARCGTKWVAVNDRE